jgi:hypothetical protein
MTTIDRQRGRDAKWQVEVLDALARIVDVLHDISDGVRELSVRVDERRTPREQTPPHRDREVLLSVEDLAVKLGLSVNAIRALRARRRGPPATMVGSRVFFQPDDVDAWLSANRDVVEASMAS